MATEDAGSRDHWLRLAPPYLNRQGSSYGQLALLFVAYENQAQWVNSLKQEIGGVQMHGVLFVESGEAGGGSFGAMYQHLLVIDRQRFHPVVVYLNETRFVELVRALGIPVYVLTDWVYSKRVPRYIRGAVGKTAMFIGKYVPVCYLKFARLVHMPLVNRLERIVRKEKIDIIHLNVNTQRDLFGLFVAETTGVVCISHLRSMESFGFDRRRPAYANGVVSAYIVASKIAKQFWEEKGIDSSKTWLVRSGASMVDIKPLDIRQVWGIDNSVRFIIGCVARLVRGKGHRFLLRAFAHFVNRYPDSVLLIVGGGSMRENLVNEARTLGIEHQAIFTGHQRRAREIIAGLDLLVLPSLMEVCPQVLLEAMLSGTPVVATTVGGIPEIVEHEYNGLLVSYGDEEELNKAMERILTDEHLRSKLVQNGYRTVRERFSIERYASEIERIYERVLGQ